MEITPDRKERIASLERHEQALCNGSRGNLDKMCDHQVDMSRAIRIMLLTDVVTPEELDARCIAKHLPSSKPHPINWPTASIIVMIGAAVYKIITGG